MSESGAVLQHVRGCRDYCAESEVSRAAVELSKVLGSRICCHLTGCCINDCFTGTD